MVYNYLIFREILNVNFRGTWYTRSSQVLGRDTSSTYTPAEKVVFPTQRFPDDVETTASGIQLHDQQDATSFDVSDDSEKVQEYNTYSNVREDLSDDEDALIFLRGVIVN